MPPLISSGDLQCMPIVSHISGSTHLNPKVIAALCCSLYCEQCPRLCTAEGCVLWLVSYDVQYLHESDHLAFAAAHDCSTW